MKHKHTSSLLHCFHFFVERSNLFTRISAAAHQQTKYYKCTNKIKLVLLYCWFYLALIDGLTVNWCWFCEASTWLKQSRVRVHCAVGVWLSSCLQPLPKK